MGNFTRSDKIPHKREDAKGASASLAYYEKVILIGIAFLHLTSLVYRKYLSKK
jgi:hypothetical protein